MIRYNFRYKVDLTTNNTLPCLTLCRFVSLNKSYYDAKPIFLCDREAVDSLCRNMTASWVRDRAKKGDGHELCDKYESYDRDGTNAG